MGDSLTPLMKIGVGPSVDKGELISGEAVGFCPKTARLSKGLAQKHTDTLPAACASTPQFTGAYRRVVLRTAAGAVAMRTMSH